MNQAIEDYLAALIGTADIQPPPEIFTGTSAAIRPPESHAVLVTADEIENVVGPLHRAKIKIMVSSPTDDRAAHSAIAQAIRPLLTGSLPAATGFHAAGFKAGAFTTGVSDDNRWVTSLDGILGIEWTGG
jgi:hypothetical protein